MANNADGRDGGMFVQERLQQCGGARLDYIGVQACLPQPSTFRIYSLTQFYFLLAAIIVVDVVSMIVLQDEPFWSRILLAVVEILIKIAIIVSLALNAKKGKDSQVS